MRPRGGAATLSLTVRSAVYNTWGSHPPPIELAPALGPPALAPALAAALAPTRGKAPATRCSKSRYFAALFLRVLARARRDSAHRRRARARRGHSRRAARARQILHQLSIVVAARTVRPIEVPITRAIVRAKFVAVTVARVRRCARPRGHRRGPIRRRVHFRACAPSSSLSRAARARRVHPIRRRARARRVPTNLNINHDRRRTRHAAPWHGAPS